MTGKLIELGYVIIYYLHDSIKKFSFRMLIITVLFSSWIILYF